MTKYLAEDSVALPGKAKASPPQPSDEEAIINELNSKLRPGRGKCKPSSRAQVRALGYLCRGTTSDLDRALTCAIERVLPKIPHQYCIKHALAALELMIGYRTQSALR